jgi:hypothetical protein
VTLADTIEHEYTRRRAARVQALDAIERRHRVLGWVRLALAGALVVALTLLGWPGWWVDLALVVLSIALAFVHQGVLQRRDRLRRAVAYYDRGFARLRHQWIGQGDAGERYRPQAHLYADDLDLFGTGSAFELVGTAQTQPGLDTLAKWLLTAAEPAEAVARQGAVRELVPRTDLREALALEGDAATADRLSALRAWAAGDRRIPVGGRVAVAATAATLVAFAIWAASVRDVTEPMALAILATFAVQGVVVLWLQTRVRTVLRAMDVPFGQLALLAGVLRTIEAESFQSARLAQVRDSLGGTTRPASVEIARLRRLVSLLDSRRDMLFAPVAASLAWATQIGGAIDAWRARVGPHVPRWIDAVGEFEALAAMATYAAERPDHVFPSFEAGAVSVQATGLAHPLLGPEAVGNDIAIGGAAPHVFIVSGSNMSGKSTFLRAIGLNVVFAQAGLPVRAASFTLTPVTVGASIRIVDSLTEGKSKFFAEVARLKLIVDLARDRKGAALFLLDEILAGTNSHDRLRGAEGVIAGLAALGAAGLVTTHDLALGDVVGRLAVPASNVHFADEFDAGGLHFDYRLRPGVVRTSNALALMRAVGLDVE